MVNWNAFFDIPFPCVSCLGDSNLDFCIMFWPCAGFFASSPDPDTVLEVLNFFLSDEVFICRTKLLLETPTLSLPVLQMFHLNILFSGSRSGYYIWTFWYKLRMPWNSMDMVEGMDFIHSWKVETCFRRISHQSIPYLEITGILNWN